MSSQYLTCDTDILIDGQLVYPAGTLLRVGAREGDCLKVGGWVNGEKRKRWLSAALCCALPSVPEGKFWEMIVPRAPAYLPRILSSEGLSGGIVLDRAEAEALAQWVESVPSHTDTPAGMQIRQHGYLLTLKYCRNEFVCGTWLYRFDFHLKGERTLG